MFSRKSKLLVSKMLDCTAENEVNIMGVVTYRYFIKKSDPEMGWVYLHKEGDFEDALFISLINELVPGNEIGRATKSEYKEITKLQYKQIIDTIAVDGNVTKLISIALK
jgi:hypothetical protein